MPTRRAAKVYNTAAWRKARLIVLERDEYRCTIQGDGCTGQATAVDHIVPWRAGGDFFALDNLRACCQTCNSKRVSAVRHSRRNPSREW